MNIINKLFNNRLKQRVRLTNKNIENWPSFNEKLKSGELKFDSKGRLRYVHGAPVGDLILVRINKDGTTKYKEAADEWFDPGCENAKKFVWP